jgi:hypothetical protein
MKNLHEVISSKKARWTVGVIGVLLAALLIFHVGVVVGSHSGQFGCSSMDRGFRSSFLPGGFELPYGFISDGHGAVGVVTAVTLPTFTVQTREGTNQTIVVSTSTIIQSMNGSDTKALSVGSQIVVLGEPDGQGRINAKMIRILPVTQIRP